jgi:succinoglycan biosynthesis transport protein ExoP
MKLIEFITLILKHKVILLLAPILAGALAVLLTLNPSHKYYSQTMLYTGLASGSSIEMDKTFNYLATNNAFDNLINIINSRETQEEVAIRLLSQHLLLDGVNEKYISTRLLKELKEDIPEELYKYVGTSSSLSKKTETKFNNNEKHTVNTVPGSVSNDNYEQTVANLKGLMNSDNTNFVYSLLNYEHPYYSLEAISKVKSMRISSSDLVKLSYETEDPGICQQTLAIYIEVCIRKYKDLKENGSDAVVKYFEAQLRQAENKLKVIEEELLKFNQDNSIINYYEQSKAVAIVKEDLDVEYNKKQAELAGSEASSKKLEQKLEIQELVQEKSNRILESKKRLGDLNYEIAMAEGKSSSSDNAQNIETLNKQASTLEKEIKSNIGQLYTFQNSVEGVPTSKILPKWVDKVIETEDLKAKLGVMNKRNNEFKKQYAKYAPAGANLKRIGRKIDVAEQEYLEILHGLNLAKLKFQDTQLSSNLKAVDPPYFPLKPIPSKRKVIIIAIAFTSFILLLGTILVMEFFDDTLKNIGVAEEKLQIPAMGMLAKLFKTNGQFDLIGIQDRLIELIMQNLFHALKANNSSNTTKVLTILSIQKDEGKTVVANNIARKLQEAGKSVLVLNHSNTEKQNSNSTKSSFLHKILGYQDPRNDYSHPFLSNITKDLKGVEFCTYAEGNEFYNAKSYEDLIRNCPEEIKKQPDFVIIELPNILEVNYPEDLMTNSDISLLVSRSNRLWSKSDENLLNKIKELIPSKLQFIINGVELNEVEALLGELAKQRSKARQRIKNILRLQFYSKSKI